MKFDLMESDQTGVHKYKTIDFSEITEEVYDDDEHTDILNEWLHAEDLNSFTSTYFFQKHVPKTYYMSMIDLTIFYKFCVNRMNYDLFRKMMLIKDDYVEKYMEEKYIEFRGDPIRFIVSREDHEILRMINYEISESDYKG